LAGIVIGGIGVAMAVAAASLEFLTWLGWFNLVWWPIAALLIAWGALLVTRCVVPVNSRMARRAEKYLPDPAGLEEAALLLVVFVLPAALLTLLLRLIGVRGQT
jgi:hypothetical protein